MSAEIIQFGTRPRIGNSKSKSSTKRKSKGRDAWYRKSKRDAFYLAHGQRLRVARRNLGISDEEAAAALQVTLRTYRKWEAGGRYSTGKYLEGACNFASRYGLSFEWLLGGKAPPPRFKLRLVP